MNNSITNWSIENKENYDQLITYLMNAAMIDYGIGVEFTNLLPPDAPPISYNKPGKCIIMNGRWSQPTEIPFQLAHEIYHVLYENQHYYNLSDNTVDSGEAEANIFAVKLLQRYCQDNDYYFDSFYKFAKCFCIPKSCYYLFDSLAQPSRNSDTNDVKLRAY